MTSIEVRKKFIEFFKKRGHVEIPPAKLVLENDPTTLFTSSGMQPLVPYLLGETHPEGKRLVDSQPSFRAEDINEVGDNRHSTFFEMLGNWSLGDYFKKEQLPWIWEFLTKELKLPKEKLHVSIFEGDGVVPKDEESFEIWESLGIPEDHIHEYGVDKNWWSRSGPPQKMPTGEIGGPDCEIFYEFTQIEHDPKFGEKCHPNCDCGRFVEIANSVFIQYQKQEDGSLKELDQKNVDFGGGLERLTAATLDNPDIFDIDLFGNVMVAIKQSQRSSDSNDRIVADHFRAAIFLILNGVEPSNKMHGYVLRRLLRRAMIKLNDRFREFGILDTHVKQICDAIIQNYVGQFGIKDEDSELVYKIIANEFAKFGKNLNVGLAKLEKAVEQGIRIDGLFAFNLYQNSGFPLEVTLEKLKELGFEFSKVDQEVFESEFKKHQELSRTASAGMFRGGLAGHSETEIKYHTVTHLLHQALRDMLGPEVFQKGSNITPERLRFDFSFDRKMTDEEIRKTEDLVNQKIKEDLKVDHKVMNIEEARKLNAIGLFNEKYSENVSIYAMGPNYSYDPEAKDKRERGGYYSMEFCGGPHVERTGQVGGIKITKEESVSAGMRRIRAELI